MRSLDGLSVDAFRLKVEINVFIYNEEESWTTSKSLIPMERGGNGSASNTAGRGEPVQTGLRDEYSSGAQCVCVSSCCSSD